ncbi:hypothetical protein [Pseudomonas sp. 6D_7.1_Bac1]|uniref:hypothetical protein n=1 Tax=Pseudomonas sp. 6D_7.1_Bac1 TaxID=2971615 RepID=UPI0021CA50E6|nr:hypothetical protein [Pseudomonas sp. 6D_7.1_Bac1]MCU1752140.1 hypothetical protein [Pseudomonas sp. 6D_7.1_Bac1]
MTPEEIADQLEAQAGVNVAVIEILKRLSSTITVRLPSDFRSDFQELIADLSRDEVVTQELSGLQKEAFDEVIDAVASTIEDTNKSFSR